MSSKLRNRHSAAQNNAGSADTKTVREVPKCVAAILPVSTPVDSALRRTGTIYMKGVAWAAMSRRNVHFDASKQCWVDDVDGTAYPKIRASDVAQRVDEVPSALIRIVGDVTFADFKNQNMEVWNQIKDMQLQEIKDYLVENHLEHDCSFLSLEKEKEEFSSLRAPSAANEGALDQDDFVDVLSLMDSAEKDPAYRRPDALGRTLRQAIAIGVTGAAIKCNGLILTSHASADVNATIGAGLASVNVDSRAKFGALGISAAENLKKLRPDDRFQGHLLLTPDEPRGKVCSHTVAVYVREVLAYLAKGDSTNLIGSPYRQPVPIVMILIGGSDLPTCRGDLEQAVRHQWPIVVVEGSSGYADTLASIIHRVQSLALTEDPDNKTALLDVYRKYLASVDPSTANIITNGRIKLLRLGAPSDEIMQVICRTVSEDPTLKMVWIQYATLYEGATSNRKLLSVFQSLILSLGILLTVLSVFQTILLSMAYEETQLSFSTSSWISMLFHLFNILIISLPIVISLLQAIMTQIDPGMKYVALHVASGAILSEIYKYRTKVGDYSDGTLLYSQQYSDRSEVLYHHVQEINNELYSDGIMSGTSLNTYTGPFPPAHIIANGDDGLSDLSPQQYYTYRLIPEILNAQKGAIALDRTNTIFNVLIYLFGAMGTLIATLSVSPRLAIYNIQAWVALTTACGNAFTRFLDYTRTEWLLKKENSNYAAISNISSWWVSRSGIADTVANREKIVLESERLFFEGVSELSKAIQTAAASSTEEAQQEQEKAAKRFGELELDRLDPDDLTSAMTDPNGPEAARMRELIMRLDAEMGNVVKKSRQEQEEKAEQARAEAAEDVEQENAQEAGELDSDGDVDLEEGDGVSVIPPLNSYGPLGSRDGARLPPHIREFVLDPVQRAKILRPLKTLILDERLKTFNPTVARRADIHELFAFSKSEVAQYAWELSQKQMWIFVKALCIMESTSDFFSSMAKLKFRKNDIMQNPNSYPRLEDLISEFRVLTMLPWRDLRKPQIIDLVRDIEFKERFGSSTFKEVSLRAMLKRAEREFSVWDRRNPQPLVLLLERAVAAIAEIDAEEILYKPIAYVKLSVPIDQAFRLKYRLDLLCRERLAGIFKGLKTNVVIRTRSHLQLLAMVEYLAACSPGLRAFRSLQASSWWSGKASGDPKDAKTDEEREAIEGEMPFALSNPIIARKFEQDLSQCDALMLSIQAIPQISLANAPKSLLLKEAATMRLLDEKAMTDMRALPERKIRQFISQLKAQIAKTATYKVFDRIDQEMALLDLRATLKLSQREALVRRGDSFIGLDYMNLSKEQLIKVLASRRLEHLFESLSMPQIQELLLRLSTFSVFPLYSRIFRYCWQVIDRRESDLLTDAMHGVSMWSDEIAASFILCVDILSDNFVLGFLSPNPSKAHRPADFIRALGDARIQSRLRGFSARQLRALVAECRTMTRDRLLVEGFADVSISLDTELSDKFNELFIFPECRSMLVRLVHYILENMPLDWNAFLHGKQSLRKLDVLKFMRKDDPCEAQFAKLMDETFSREEISKILLAFMADATFLLPDRIFRRLCDVVTTCNLRELAIHTVDRFRFIQLLRAVVQSSSSGGGSFRDLEMVHLPPECEDLSLADKRSDLYFVSPVIENKAFIRIAKSSPSAKGKNSFREWFVGVMTEAIEQDPVMTAYVSILRPLSERQLADIIICAHRLLEHSVGGKLFQFVFDKQLQALNAVFLDAKANDEIEDLDVSSQLVMYEACCEIRSAVVMNSAEFYEILDDREYVRFSSRLMRDRRSRLSQVLQTADLLDVVCSFNQLETREWFRLISGLHFVIPNTANQTKKRDFVQKYDRSGTNDAAHTVRVITQPNTQSATAVHFDIDSDDDADPAADVHQMHRNSSGDRCITTYEALRRPPPFADS